MCPSSIFHTPYWSCVHWWSQKRLLGCQFWCTLAPKWNISKAIGWIAMKFDIHFLLRMNCSHSEDPLTFYLAPSSCQNSFLSTALVYDHIPSCKTIDIPINLFSNQLETPNTGPIPASLICWLQIWRSRESALLRLIWLKNVILFRRNVACEKLPQLVRTMMLPSVFE